MQNWLAQYVKLASFLIFRRVWKQISVKSVKFSRNNLMWNKVCPKITFLPFHSWKDISACLLMWTYIKPGYLSLYKVQCAGFLLTTIYQYFSSSINIDSVSPLCLIMVPTGKGTTHKKVSVLYTSKPGFLLYLIWFDWNKIKHFHWYETELKHSNYSFCR